MCIQVSVSSWNKNEGITNQSRNPFEREEGKSGSRWEVKMSVHRIFHFPSHVFWINFEKDYNFIPSSGQDRIWDLLISEMFTKSPKQYVNEIQQAKRSRILHQSPCQDPASIYGMGCCWFESQTCHLLQLQRTFHPDETAKCQWTLVPVSLALSGLNIVY